ncbi:MAG TPA: sulfatase [Phycisphaerae bacterium]|nr:sulfatase [Phycisphaerae bacterium]HRT52094.1 sulfatase [Anaerohalosphaeraceae bacterium]
MGRPYPNVILITISSLRADHVGCLGYERDTTPHLDAFAKENLLFSNAYAVSSWMMPAHGTVFTGLYPSGHGATHVDKDLSVHPQTLAEILKDYGYYCAAFCCNPRLDTEHGFGQGFDFYDDFSVRLILESLELSGKEVNIDQSRTNPLVNDAAVRWLQCNRHRPFFLFLHYYDTHWDYVPAKPYGTEYDADYKGPIDGTNIAREPLFSNPPAEEDIRHIVALYDGEVRQTDDDLGEMLSFLDDCGLMEDSLVVVMGDHGEQFYEHGHTSHHGIFDELLHVPVMVSAPKLSQKCGRIESLISQIDVMPTILEYLAIPIPTQCEGRSLVPLLMGNSQAVNEYVFAEYTGGAAPNAYIIRSLQHKCVVAEGVTFAYDLTKDLGEQRKLSRSAFTDQMLSLSDRLDAWLKQHVKPQ